MMLDTGAEPGSLLLFHQASHRPAMHQGRCEWVIRLNQDLPTELNLKFGAGKAELKLAGLMLTRLRVESGVGELTKVGLGSVHPHGLTWDGQAYANALYGQAAVNLDITVEGGIGKINLEQTRQA